MANTTFQRAVTGAYAASHANLIEQKWARKAFKVGLEKNPYAPFMGTDENSIIQINKDFLKEKGDKITFHLRAKMTEAGQGDDGILEGNEEANVFYDDSVTIHQRMHATKVNGMMTEQRTSIPLRDAGKDSLGEWLADIAAHDITAALSGVNNTKTFAGQITGAAAMGSDITSSTTQILTVNGQALYGGEKATSTVASIEGGRLFVGGQTTAGVLSKYSTDAYLSATAGVNLFGTRVISFVKKMAKATRNTKTGAAIVPIQPIRIDGKDWYVMFVHPWQVDALKKETAWLSYQKDAMPRGKDNPLFTGAIGAFDGVVIHENPFIHVRYGANGTTSSEYFYSSDIIVTSGVRTARALFCGKQAALLAYGAMPTWKEKSFEYGTKWGIATTTIYGVKNGCFNSVNFGVIGVDTVIEES